MICLDFRKNHRFHVIQSGARWLRRTQIRQVTSSERSSFVSGGSRDGLDGLVHGSWPRCRWQILRNMEVLWHGNIQYGTYIGESWDLFQSRFISVAIWGWFQWPWLRNRLIGGTYHIFLAYFLCLCKGISQQNMAWTMVQYLHFRILKFPWMNGGFHGKMSYTPWRICPLVCFITGGYLQHPAARAPSPVTSCFIIYDHIWIWLSICTT